MTPEEFETTLGRDLPPDGAPPLLIALWHEARGDWAAAHRIAQADEGRDGAWVHAYLHRAEGDLDNAGYWYRRAGRPVADGPLEVERRSIVTELLGR